MKFYEDFAPTRRANHKLFIETVVYSQHVALPC